MSHALNFLKNFRFNQLSGKKYFLNVEYYIPWCEEILIMYSQ